MSLICRYLYLRKRQHGDRIIQTNPLPKSAGLEPMRRKRGAAPSGKIRLSPAACAAGREWPTAVRWTRRPPGLPARAAGAIVAAKRREFRAARKTRRAEGAAPQFYDVRSPWRGASDGV
jgi:hypothetical protein